MKQCRKRLLQGLFLGFGAPLGWLLVSRLTGVWSPGMVELESYHYWVLAYMLLGTVTAFGLFGYLIGKKEDRFAEMSLVDSLTDLHNTRYFHTALRTEFANAVRHKTPLSLLLLDLDHFKEVNDTYGHQAGDEVLRLVAAVVRESVREGDTVARVGGEEFAVILPSTASINATELAERIRAAIRGRFIALPDGTRITVRASLGVAGTDVVEVASPTEFFSVVDKALYAAKTGGRDRVSIAANSDSISM